MYTKFLAIGLFRLLELGGAKDPKALEGLVTALNVRTSAVNRDLLTYKARPAPRPPPRAPPPAPVPCPNPRSLQAAQSHLRLRAPPGLRCLPVQWTCPLRLSSCIDTCLKAPV